MGLGMWYVGVLGLWWGSCLIRLCSHSSRTPPARGRVTRQGWTATTTTKAERFLLGHRPPPHYHHHATSRHTNYHPHHPLHLDKCLRPHLYHQLNPYKGWPLGRPRAAWLAPGSHRPPCTNYHHPPILQRASALHRLDHLFLCRSNLSRLQLTTNY